MPWLSPCARHRVFCRSILSARPTHIGASFCSADLVNCSAAWPVRFAGGFRSPGRLGGLRTFRDRFRGLY